MRTVTKKMLEEQLKHQLTRIDQNKAQFLKYQSQILDGGDTRDSLLDYILSSERLAVNARSLPSIELGPDWVPNIKTALPAAHDITVSLLPEGWVYLTMDALLPSKGRQVPKEFIFFPLTYSLDKFQQEQLYQLAYSRTAIVVRHVYQEDTPMGVIRDHDNIETKTLIDTIEAHLLPSDSGLTCSVLFLSRFGVKNMTEVYLLPYSDLPAWQEFYG